MDEQKKYELIKRFVDAGEKGNKNRISLELGITRRHLNRLINNYKKYGKAAFSARNCEAAAALGIQTLNPANGSDWREDVFSITGARD